MQVMRLHATSTPTPCALSTIELKGVTQASSIPVGQTFEGFPLGPGSTGGLLPKFKGATNLWGYFFIPGGCS